MRILSVVGARPQFVKLAVISRAVTERGTPWVHRIVHTGQHYDRGMSSVFFEELGIPKPDYDLGVGSGPHGEQTGEMLKRLEPILIAEKPDWVLLYGDTNSTLAGAIAASKLCLPTAHIEAGLRSYRRSMPEEVNRIATDHLSDLLLCPTELAIANLRKEGLETRAVLTGDVMLDAVLVSSAVAERQCTSLAERWSRGTFCLATAHRAENTDDPDRLRQIVKALHHIAETVCSVVWPVHPRTQSRIQEIGLSTGSITTMGPVSYLEMLVLENRARFILTDSGGVQKEAYFFKVPCITLRAETEWQETLQNGCNILTDCTTERILEGVTASANAGPWTAAYGDGTAGIRILNALDEARAHNSRVSAEQV